MFRYLSVRLLTLIALFIVVIQIILTVPLIAQYRDNWINRKVTEIQSVIFTMKEENIGPMERSLIGVYQITEYGVDEILLDIQLEADFPEPTAFLNLSDDSRVLSIRNAFLTLFYGGRRALELSTPLQEGDARLSIIMDEKPLFDDLADFTQQLIIIIAISLGIVSAVGYVLLNRMLIKPIVRLKNNLVEFQKKPEDQNAVLPVNDARNDELGLVERELAQMQLSLSANLRQKNRLVTLGTAVSKISHDLTNILQTGILISERLEMIKDPDVVKVTPKLMDSLDRAMELCEQVLSYTKDGVLSLRLTYFSFSVLVDEVESYVRVSERRRHIRRDEVAWKNEVAFDLIVHCDRDQITRVLMNLGRNAIQAGARAIKITSVLRPNILEITFADNGPGLTLKAKETLFKPFSEGTRLSGTGLGLAIAYEIMNSHGGTIEIGETPPEGMNTVFILKFPISVVIDKIPE